VYAAIRQIGEIFSVRAVANQLISEIKNDLVIAETTVASLSADVGHAGLRAAWFDCFKCCGPEELYIGAGQGALNLIIENAGMINVFSELPGNWVCVDIPTFLASQPDVVIIVDASWNTAVAKIDFLHNHSQACLMPFVQQADYITIPFSASTLGPRNGVASLDMASAALHLITGNVRMDFRSGVSFFNPEMLMNRTSKLVCPFVPKQAIATNSPLARPFWAIAVVVITLVLFLAMAIFAFIMFRQERVGQPIFVSLKEVVKQLPGESPRI
jgi:hypothetical protein